MALTKMDSGSKQIENRSLIAPTGEQKEIKFGVKAEDMAFIMDRLTEQYNKADMSSLRELISNAIDATVILPEAERLPIKVSTPTALRPTLVVEDFGTGMSLDVLEDVYCNFGSSTKRTDFMQIGSKGLGAKAPLAYCEEFFLVTTHAGITVEAVVKRTAEGPTLKTLSVKETGAHSGTKVTMPIKAADVLNFSRYMENYSAFTSDDYSLELNGKPLESKNDEYIYLDNFLLDEDDNVEGRLWVRRQHLAQSALSDLIYGKAFTPEFTLSGWRYGNHMNYSQPNAVLELKPGVVEFVSSRDSIKFDERYHALLKRFNAKYGKPTEELLRGVMAAYRSLDADKAISFILAAKNRGMLKISKDGEITLTVKPSNITNFTPVSLNLTLEDFALDEGGNPMRLLTATEDKVTGIVAHFTMGDERSVRTFALHSFASKGESGDAKMVQNQRIVRVSEMRDCMVELVDKDISSTMESALRAVVGSFNNTLIAYKSPHVIHGVSGDDVQEFMRHRRALERYGFANCSVFLAEGEIPRESLMEVEHILGEVKQLSMEEFREETLNPAIEAEKKRRKEAAKERVKEEKERTATFYDAGTITKNLSNLNSSAKAHSSTVAEIMEEEAVIIISTNIKHTYYRDHASAMVDQARNTAIGAMNTDESTLTGKKLYIVEAGKLNAKDYTALREYPHVYLNRSASYNCKAFTEMQATRVRHGSVLLTSLEVRRGEMLGFLITRDTTFSPKFVKLLADYLEDVPYASELLRDAKECNRAFLASVTKAAEAVAHFTNSMKDEERGALEAINSALCAVSQDEHRAPYAKIAFSNSYHDEDGKHSGPIFEMICGGIATEIKEALAR